MTSSLRRVAATFAAVGALTAWFATGPITPASAVLPPQPAVFPSQTLASGDKHTCSLTVGGNATCWGDNYAGQVGLPGGGHFTVGQPVPGLGHIVQIAAGGDHTCALLNDTTVRCWGTNTHGELGFVGSNTSTPTAVVGLSGVKQLSLGASHSCALLNAGTVKCWGSNSHGELGDGTNTTVATPTLVFGIGDAIELSAGGTHTCAVLSNNTGKCWGSGSYGELGSPANGLNASNVPVTVNPLLGILQISAGRYHTCALAYNGVVKCWGFNSYGQLGNNSIVQSIAPVSVMGIATATELGSGSYHTCAILSTAHIQCWGNNLDGGLGNGTTANSSVPVDVTGITTGVHVVGGYYHTCAQIGTGAIKCWGYNDQGQVGNNSFTNALTPVDVQNLIDPANEFTSIVPGRIMDTRPGATTIDHQAEGIGVRVAKSTTQLVVAGRAGIPIDARSASLNVTVTGAQGSGFLTVYPCDAPKPNASNVNYVTGDTIANVVLSSMDPTGHVCLYTEAAVDLIVDVNGYYPAVATYIPLVPGRLADTRQGATTVDHQVEAIGILGNGSTTHVPLGSRYGIPSDALAVALNITATGSTQGGYLTVYPCGTTQPNSSNLNFNAGQTIANADIAKLGTNGEICVYADQATHLLVDVTGYYPSVSLYAPLPPARLLDTRLGSTTVDHLQQAIGTRMAKSQTTLSVISRGGVSATARTVALNVTVTGSTAGGYVTVWPCGATQPNASNLNYNSGQTIANAVIAKTDANGQVCFYTDTATELIVDVAGYYP